MHLNIKTKFYKQIDGCAIGFPLAPIIPEISEKSKRQLSYKNTQGQGKGFSKTHVLYCILRDTLAAGFLADAPHGVAVNTPSTAASSLLASHIMSV